MNGSMWILTAACLACGAPDSATTAATTAQAAPAPRVVQIPSVGVQDSVQTVGGHAYGGSCDSACVDAAGACEEHPGLLARLFARLRALFSRCHTASCCENVAQCETTCGECEHHRLRLGERLARLFHRPCCPETACCAPAPTMIVQMMPATPVLPPVQLAAPLPPAPVIQPVSTAPARLATTPPTQIAKEYLNRVANADDYSWVTGQLFYIHVHADQGLWFVRYAPIDKEDRYGGSVVLAPATSMTSFREGDLVTVHGEILNQGRASRYLGGPLYRALAVELKARARP